MDRQLRQFNAGGKDAAFFKLALWWVLQNSGFSSFLAPSRVRVSLLRLFGAQIGKRLVIRRGVKIHFPWNLSIGDDSWIGEGVWIINHVQISIGSNVCVSQDSIISSGSHDIYSPSLQYKHAPIEIKDGAWLCLRSTVLPGVVVGRNSIVSAGEVLRKSLPDNCLYIENMVRPINYLTE